MSGAIDWDACTTRKPRGRGAARGLCRCEPKCSVCGYGPHVGIHGPGLGQPPGSRPCGHEYQPPTELRLPSKRGEQGAVLE